MPAPCAFAESTRSVGRSPTHIAFTSGLRAYASSKRALAADVRDADAVAVVADAGDRALEVPVGRAEAQAVEERDRPGAHRDDVAEDPADAGRGALERLDGRRDGCATRP